MQAVTEYVRPLVNIEHYVDKEPETRQFIMHVHNVNEILFFISGDATYMVEGSEYKLIPGCIMFMRAGEAHMLRIRSSAPYERIVLQFSDSLFADANKDCKILEILNKKPLGFFNYFEPDADFKTYMYNACKNTFEDDESNLINLKANLVAALSLLTEKYIKRKNIKQDSDKSHIRSIIEYINANLFTDITLDSICRTFYVNKSQLNRRFKEVTGSTVWDYVIIKRLVAARRLIKDGVKASIAAEMTGFHDYSNFYRAYKSHFEFSPKTDSKA